MQLERLEDRSLLSAVPFGALPDDTAEYMLGDVLVSVVLMESREQTSPINPNSESWTSQTIAAAKAKVAEGMSWWAQTLAEQFPSAVGSLQFQYDFRYADQPVLTSYEPIHNASSAFRYWIYDFLNQVGHNATRDFSRDIRAFNHAQRLAHGTDWAFTIFVVNDTNDADGMFAGGPFFRAFAYAGGQFLVSPAGRPASTFAHETGHMFWARDEYQGGGSYTDQRGYYDTANANAWDNPTPGFVQTPSLMARDELTVSPPRLLLSSAWANHTSSTSSLEMIGWRDSDGDGILDVVDVPHALVGGGYFDPQTETYRFQGTSTVTTLTNQNPSGLQSDITINRISRAQYRLDGGPWQTAATFSPAAEVALELSIPLLASGAGTIEIRTLDDRTGVASNIFQGLTGELAAVLEPGINGFVWEDGDQDGQYDAGELPLPGWTVRLVDAAGQPLQLAQQLEPDAFAEGARLDQVSGAAGLRAQVNGFWRGVVAFTSAEAPTGTRVLGYQDSSGITVRAGWDKYAKLRIDFTSPVTAVRLDAAGTGTADYARLAVYNAQGELLQRVTSGPLGSGQVETLAIERGSADIAYAVAGQHGDTTILLDNLWFGPETVTVTDSWGGYSLPALSPGTYHVQAVAPDAPHPAPSVLTVTVPEGEAEGSIGAVGSVNFAAQQRPPSWRNPEDPCDVNDDGFVSALDALVMINYINSRQGDLSVPAPPATPGPYYDVDDNGYITTTDVLMVINYLNQLPTAAGESPPGASGPHGAPAFDQSGEAEGEALPLRSLTAGLIEAGPVPDASWGHAASRPAPGNGATLTVPTQVQRSSPDRLQGRQSSSRNEILAIGQTAPAADPWDEVLLQILSEQGFGKVPGG